MGWSLGLMDMDVTPGSAANASETRMLHHPPYPSGHLTVSATSTRAAFECAARLASTLTGARRVSLLLLGGEEKVWVGAAEGSSLEVGQTLLLGRGVASEALRTQSPMIVHDLGQASFPTHPERGYSTLSCMAAPVRWGDALYGVICAADPSASAAFCADHLGALQLLADHLGACLHTLAHASSAANTDPLTGLPTRRAFEETLSTEALRSLRFGRPVSLVLMDIDNLKRLNEIEGHLAGNRALQRVARALVETVRSIDLVARYGGDEFAILLAETGPEESLKVARRVAFSLRWLPMMGHQRSLFFLRAHLGVATLPPAKGASELVEHALEAMHLSKGDREGIRHWDLDLQNRTGVSYNCMCRLCGKAFVVESAAQQRERRYCSIVCAAAARRRAKQDRNSEIWALRQSGLTLQAIALQYGISEERVRQICDRRSATSLGVGVARASEGEARSSSGADCPPAICLEAGGLD